MEKRTEKPDWAKNIEAGLNGLKENEKECEKITELDYRDYAKTSYDLARKKYAGEMKAYQKALDAGYVIVDTIVNLPFKESAGLRLSKFFEALRGEARILALRCPECGRVIFPPRPVCGFCRITIGESSKDWLELRDTGTVTSIVLPTEREVDRATGRIVGEPNPCGFIRLDGGDEWTVLVHYLEMTNLEKLHRGMRVKAVWKPKEERRGRMTDIAFFRIVED
ncbi:MAG: zinc ribbon domain-containing protein [Desulfobacterales bacterium]|nr:zinc ribbon domain-containing protein [Desulfobacterales bacterium]